MRADPGGAAVTTNSYSYDSADRLVSESSVDAGAWVYDPLGRITTAPVRGSPGASRDPSPGGNSTAYDYCSGDPVNCTDLDGHWGFFKNLVKKYAAKVAKVAEVVATVVPGPIGAAAAAISAGAYAATGNRAKALEMGVTAVAAMIPGGGAMVKAGFDAARTAGRVAAKVGASVNKVAKRTGCGGGTRNSFSPDTPVLMADGSTQEIGDIQVGDLVVAQDPVTGEVTDEPVLNVIIGVGDKHLMTVMTSRAPPAIADGEDSGSPAADSWTATAQHPVWVQGQGWIEVEDLEVGDPTVGTDGLPRAVSAITDYGWLPGQTVLNLTVANAHAYFVGESDSRTLVHNDSDPQCLIAAAVGPGPHARGFVRGTAGRIQSAAQALVNKLGNKHGCHSCGAKSPGTKSGNWVGNHWPPRSLKAWFPNVKFTFRPQCLPCSKSQGGTIRGLITKLGRGPR
jgi:hypothetical protein